MKKLLLLVVIFSLCFASCESKPSLLQDLQDHIDCLQSDADKSICQNMIDSIERKLNGNW